MFDINKIWEFSKNDTGIYNDTLKCNLVAAINDCCDNVCIVVESGHFTDMEGAISFAKVFNPKVIRIFSLNTDGIGAMYCLGEFSDDWGSYSLDASDKS